MPIKKNELLSKLHLRGMTESDIPAIQPLLVQLGYELSLDETRRRFAAVIESGDHTLLIAELEGRVVGLLHIYARPALEKPPEAIVQALVVDTACRKGGIGKAFMAAAEHWARERGFQSVALASNIVRHEAHAFYAALGYRLTTTSHLSRKEID